MTEKAHGLVVDYHGVSRNLEAALSTFEWPDVQDAMRELDEDPAPVIESAAIQAESYFKGRDLSDTWACVAIFAPDAATEGDFKADLYEPFNADYRRFSRLMDLFLPNPRALTYVDRLARLTEIRAYVRAQYLREDAAVDWTEIGAKVKRLVDERISAGVRELMTPVSVLDSDFEQKIAALPHDEARASVMEHAIRAQIHERLADNPAYFEKLSAQLSRIIEDLRNRLIDSAEACKRQSALRHQIQSEAAIAAEHGLTPVSFAIYELLDGYSREPVPAETVREETDSNRTHFDEEVKNIALEVEKALSKHRTVVDWESNLDVQREMRRDIKHALRPTGDYTEERLDAMAIPDRRPGPPEGRAVIQRGRIRFGDTTIEYEVRRSARRRKTVQITVDGGGVQVVAPAETPDSELRDIVRKRAPWILAHASGALLEAAPKRFLSGETLPYLGRNVRTVFEPADVRSPKVRFDHWRFRIAVPRSPRRRGTLRTDPPRHRRVVPGPRRRAPAGKHRPLVASVGLGRDAEDTHP